MTTTAQITAQNGLYGGRQPNQATWCGPHFKLLLTALKFALQIVDVALTTSLSIKTFSEMPVIVNNLKNMAYLE